MSAILNLCQKVLSVESMPEIGWREIFAAEEEYKAMDKQLDDYRWVVRYLNEWGLAKDRELSRISQSAQQSVQRMGGTVRKIRYSSSHVGGRHAHR